MSISHTNDAGQCLIVISGEMSVYTAKLTQSSLLELLQTENRIRVDLSEVDDIDSAGVQLLLSLRKYAQKKDIDLQFHSHSQCVLDLIELYQIAAELGDPLLLTRHEA